ncbi:ATP-binding protein [Streptomyces capitiformicae]|uniref:histidine kinase n=1 Tax=Streptomyces capitiformicae TaxID=2014920 RepID=A0A918Z6R9_9ACTN|nr:ATP-binding protein [Streptomyces capitiformicae]GHE38281.1 histidine kinase [Streptomyces capitiformicae]
MTAPSPPRPPGERPALRSILPAPLVTAVLGAVVVGGSVALAPDSMRPPLAAGAGAAALLLTVAVALTVHARQSVRLLRHRLDAVSRDAGLLLQERARMAEEFGQERGRLTEESVQERARIAAEFARERTRLTAEFERERERLAEERERTAEETVQETTRLTERARQAEAERTAVLAVTANVAGRMQALATGTLADLRAMEERHSDEDVLADLLHLDHRTAQAGRLADSVAVLAGARSGRRWARPIPMESILRGAMGRIGAYRRVRLHSSSESAVAGHAAEGVMHALAELLDNAANFSPPTAEVHVYVEEVPAGAIISVEDSGLVMSDVQLRRAERAVSGESADLAGLAGTRLGLAVVGRLARKHGLKVSFRPSARGGTGVLMLIPQDILASSTGTGTGTVPTAASPASSTATTAATAATASDRPSQSYGAVRAPYDLSPEPTPTHEFPADSPTTTAEEFPTGPDALPRRRRGRSLAEAEARTGAQAADARPARDSRPAEDASTGAVRFSSFRRAVRGTSGLDQAFVQGTAAGDEPVRDPVRDPVREPVRDVPDVTPAPEEVVSHPMLEPVRELEWGAVPEPKWEPAWEAAPVPEPGWEPEPVRGATWEPEPGPEPKWELDPVREPHPAQTDPHSPDSLAPQTHPTHPTHPHPHLEGDPTP